MKKARFVGVLGLLVLPLSLIPTPARAATEQLPDLRAARPKEIHTTTTSTGQRELRFTSVVSNVGAGPFQLTGTRSSTSDAEMNTVTQQIFDDTGSVSRSATTTATMYFGGDGHDHWHVRDLETFELIRTDNGALVGTGEKHGFCFFDNTRVNLALPNAPQERVYTGCGKTSNLQVVMGLSVGWGDRYKYTLPDQFIDITGLAAGRYRLIYRVDVPNWFSELKETNNRSCTTLQLTGTSVSVLDYKCRG
jgi:hypothetical protein